jgi:2,3,4,5-tetrahydropyridine-2-carboxylate N-succinyltransferase
MRIDALQADIQAAYAKRDQYSPENAPETLKATLLELFTDLEQGTRRIAHPPTTPGGTWQVNLWLKEAILLYFKLFDNHIIPSEFTTFYDKVPLRFAQASAAEFQHLKTRVVPPSVIRRGAYLGPNTVVMPSFINIGAYVGAGSMVDSWVTVGSCAQIGARVHLANAVGIGGVLEPVQAHPTIIEDDCFIGAHAEIVEGVIVRQGAVISMGVSIGQSTRIYDRVHDTLSYGEVPANAVVVPGTLPSADGTCQIYSAIIVKYVDYKTRQKIGLNACLRYD